MNILVLSRLQSQYSVFLRREYTILMVNVGIRFRYSFEVIFQFIYIILNSFYVLRQVKSLNTYLEAKYHISSFLSWGTPHRYSPPGVEGESCQNLTD